MRNAFRLLVGAVALIAGHAAAQNWAPTRPVTLTVGFAPGGGTDTAGRIVAKKLSENIGQSIIVENKAGAGGNIAAQHAATTAPDGYLIHLSSVGPLTVAPAMSKNLPYDPKKDLSPITLGMMFPNVFVVHPNVPAKTLAEFVALAKAKPGEVNYASSGPGQSTHLSAELFSTMAGVKMTHVPYKGSAPALTDTMGGQTAIFFDTMLSAMPHVRGGKLKALAVTSAQRSPAAPDIPTVAESGLPGYEAIAWNGLLAPAGTPKEVVAKLNAEMKKALELPEIKERFAAQGFAAAYSTPEDYAKFINAEVDKWARVVKVSGATVD